MKILVINATPKTDGICYSFVTTAAETAAQLGVEAEVIRLSSMNLSKCKMCDDGWGICFNEHRCIFGDKDGFNDLQKKVQEADAFVYITPVYWGEINEELKIFLDKLRRCQATKQWDNRETEVSFLNGKPSIMVASAGGGGGGIVSTFADIERAISQMSGDSWPRELNGVFDYIAVNRWNQAYKRETLKAAITEMVKYRKTPRVTEVEPQADYQLLLTFNNGEQRIFDVKPYLNIKRYEKLKDQEIFKNVWVSGVYVSWGNNQEIGLDPLYLDSVPVNK